MQQILDCVDAGSEFCPCYLSETGECIICSQLQGKTFCDCSNWKGVCIYQGFVLNKKSMKEGRRSFVSKVIHSRNVSQNIVVLTIQVNQTIARELNQPGAYVFLRNLEEPSFFDAPMSVMKADVLAGTLEIAVQIKGVKTKSLVEMDGELLVRGPYWNGLLGLKYLKTLRDSRALLVARGIGQAPAVAIARKLILAGNQVEVILDAGRGGVNFAESYLEELGCQITYMPVLNNNLAVPEETLDYIKQSLLDRGIKLIYSGGSEKLHEGIGGLIKGLDKEVYLVCSNDAKFCCGEGVCGSCHTRLPDGPRIKTCKTQVNPLEVFGGRQNNG